MGQNTDQYYVRILSSIIMCFVVYVEVFCGRGICISLLFAYHEEIITIVYRTYKISYGSVRKQRKRSP